MDQKCLVTKPQVDAYNVYTANISYFYEGLETGNKEATVTQHQRMCIEVSRNFMKIENTEHQNAVNTLIKSLIKDKAA